MKTVLLIRDFRSFTGGHLKVFHYMEHILNSGFARPRVLLSRESLRDGSNPFLAYPELVVDAPVAHDLLFLGGRDWPAAEALGLLGAGIPVINFIQNVLHGNPDSPFRRWLGYQATRICVGEEVAAAIRATGEANGPLHVVVYGIEALDGLRLDQVARTVDVFVAGIKDAKLARDIELHLGQTGLSCEVMTQSLPRQDYLRRLRRARIAIMLPMLQEGGYLPALEAMALGVCVVCPDTPGIHSFSRHNETAVLTAREAGALVEAALALLANPAASARLRANGFAMVASCALAHERAAFLRILAQTMGV